MILEVDCGNSLIKWRLLERASMDALAGGVVECAQQLVDQVAGRGVGIAACRLVSVRSDEETAAVSIALDKAFEVVTRVAKPAKELAGVKNAYEQHERLGLDRWLAVVGGYHLAKGACVIIDLGTAVTSDYVSAEGEHLGGYICPGSPLMRAHLQTHTRRTRYSAAEAQNVLNNLTPGRSTAEAVERGCLMMLRGFVSAQIELAHELLPEGFSVFLTGGDSLMVKDVVPQARIVSDLVFIGLAIACPVE